MLYINFNMSIDRVEEWLFQQELLSVTCTDLIVLRVHCVLKNIACRTVVLSATNVRNYTVNEKGEHGIDRSVGLGKSAMPTLILRDFSFQSEVPRT